MENDKFQELVVNQLSTLTNLVTDIGGKVGNLETRMDNLDSRMDNLDSRMDKLDSRMDKLDSRMDKLEIKIENEVVDKIRILFDAQAITNERLANIEETLEIVQTDVRYVVARVTRLEKMA